MSAYEESIETYRIILNEYTDTPTGQEAAELAAEVYVAWALQLRATEDYATAVEKYQAALSEYPDTPAAVKAPEMIAATYAAWAAQLREAGRLLNAAEKYELILHQYPDTPLGEQAATLAAETYGEWAAYLREVGKYQKAVETYQLIFQRYPDTPAASGVEVAVAELYEMARQAMADDQACAAVSVLDAFIRADFMLANEAAATMPEALYSCGLADYAAGDYQGAIARYEALIEDYPASPLVDDAEAAVVDARVADIRASGTGELPPPQVVGRAPSGTTVVVVSNDSPERLEILLSGPSSKSLVVERCPTCQKYLGVGPVYCPEAGPQVRISLQPGQYEVVVRAIDDPDITPWSGSWELGDGEEFFNCFFIVTTFG
jgi:outer membrane protein assembly factor BamD (BamD/ComL family)